MTDAPPTKTTGPSMWDPISTLELPMFPDSGPEPRVGDFNVEARPRNRGSLVAVRSYGESYREFTHDEARQVAAALLEAVRVGEETWPESVYPPIVEPEPEPYKKPVCKSCGRIMATAKHESGTCRTCRVPEPPKCSMCGTEISLTASRTGGRCKPCGPRFPGRRY